MRECASRRPSKSKAAKSTGRLGALDPSAQCVRMVCPRKSRHIWTDRARADCRCRSLERWPEGQLMKHRRLSSGSSIGSRQTLCPKTSYSMMGHESAVVAHSRLHLVQACSGSIEMGSGAALPTFVDASRAVRTIPESQRSARFDKGPGGRRFLERNKTVIEILGQTDLSEQLG